MSLREMVWVTKSRQLPGGWDGAPGRAKGLLWACLGHVKFYLQKVASTTRTAAGAAPIVSGRGPLLAISALMTPAADKDHVLTVMIVLDDSDLLARPL